MSIGRELLLEGTQCVLTRWRRGVGCGVHGKCSIILYREDFAYVLEFDRSFAGGGGNEGPLTAWLD